MTGLHTMITEYNNLRALAVVATDVAFYCNLIDQMDELVARLGGRVEYTEEGIAVLSGR